MLLHRDRIEAVDQESVVRVLNTYLTRDNRTIGVFLPDSEPQRAEIPPSPDLETLLADYQGREVEQIEEVFEPTAENIEAQRIAFTLSNGAKVTVLPKPTRGQRVWGQITMRMGNLESLSGLGDVPLRTTQMLTRGSENYSRQAIRDEIDRLRSSMSIGGNQRTSVAIESQRNQLTEVLEIVEDVLKNPVFPASELEELKRQSITAIDQQRDEPSGVASYLLGRQLNAYPEDHPFYSPSWTEQIERLQDLGREELVAHHASHFGMGPETTISFVGDIDVDELRNALESAFGNWTPKVAYERIQPTYMATQGDMLTEQMPDKANAMFIGIQNLPIGSDHPDYPALMLAGELLGGGFLNSRLADRIRDQEGLSYGVGGRFQASDLDEQGNFLSYAMFAPQNKDRLVEVMFEELNKAVEEGFGSEEVDAVRSGYLKELELRLSSDQALNGLLNQNLYLDRDLFYWSRYEDAIKALDAEDINAAVQRHLQPDQWLSIAVGDFADKDAASD